MKKTLLSTQALVKFILENCPETRDSDTKLYMIVCESLNRDALRKPFCYVITHLHELGLPPFETVRRARQKIQAKCPELCPCDTVALFRAENEKAFEEFAIGGC